MHILYLFDSCIMCNTVSLQFKLEIHAVHSSGHLKISLKNLFKLKKKHISNLVFHALRAIKTQRKKILTEDIIINA